MSEQSTMKKRIRSIRVRHRGRLEQIRIYLGKMLRMFVYENDWKVLPMAALIAALVSMVIRDKIFVNMEGDLMGAFSLTCVAIWNGCFNSIQVICRERPIIKREHRSGMHISSYIISHMIYQALLCLAQSALTVVVCQYSGLNIPVQGFITDWMIVDIALTLFFISYASDMLSLWISAIAHSTTTAMTIMPFVLIFQLVFSGGIFALPEWSEAISDFTISSSGLKCLAAQADYNNAPMATGWTTLQKLQDKEIGGTVTVGQVLDFFSDQDNKVIADIRSREIMATTTVGELWGKISSSSTYRELYNQQINVSNALNLLSKGEASDENPKDLRTILQTVISSEEGTEGTDAEMIQVGKIIEWLQLNQIAENMKDQQIGAQMTVGELVDLIASNPDASSFRDKGISLKTTVGRLMEMIGVDKVKDMIQRQTAIVSRVPDYERTLENILAYWLKLVFFAGIYALLAMITLEFIDKDKR